jgi:hypothetical protein
MGTVGWVIKRQTVLLTLLYKNPQLREVYLAGNHSCNLKKLNYENLKPIV